MNNQLLLDDHVLHKAFQNKVELQEASLKKSSIKCGFCGYFLNHSPNKCTVNFHLTTMEKGGIF